MSLASKALRHNVPTECDSSLDFERFWIRKWRKCFGVIDDVEVKIPLPGEHAQAPPECYIAFSDRKLSLKFLPPRRNDARFAQNLPIGSRLRAIRSCLSSRTKLTTIMGMGTLFWVHQKPLGIF